MLLKIFQDLTAVYLISEFQSILLNSYIRIFSATGYE